MREIKFRAWDKKRKEFREPPEIHNWDSEDFDFFREYWNYSDFQQYTGLKDKNGKEIYEGDCIKQENSLGSLDNPEYYSGYIIYSAPEFILQIIGPRGGKRGNVEISAFNQDDCEVIGNIYENKKEGV